LNNKDGNRSRIKPQQGYGFAALLNPGMVSGETGINEKGITVSENNIHIRQTEL
jgi:hypothetical protein